MRISGQLIEQIKEFEGFRDYAYVCPGGYKTIGYGHLLSEQENINQVSYEKAEELLLEDIAKTEAIIKRNIKVELTQGQYDALVSFTFNVGAACLQRSTLRQKVNRLEHQDVPIEIRRFIYAGGKILLGLVKRREIEALMYNS